MVAPAEVTLEYGSRTHALVGSQALQSTDTTFTRYAGILKPSGDYFYYVGADSDLHIIDVSDPANPTDQGTATPIDGLCDNQAITGLAWDSSGRYLYVPNGNSSMYVLDTSPDPTSPALDATITITSASTNSRHVIVRGDSNASRSNESLYILTDDDGAGNSVLEVWDISTPDSPSSAGSTSNSPALDCEFGTFDNEQKNFLAPEMNVGTPNGAIHSWIADGATLASRTDINIPDFSGGSETITVSGNLLFDAGVNADRVWFVGEYTSSGNKSYFWVVIDRLGDEWEGDSAGEINMQIVSDLPDANDEITPTHYIANEPIDAVGHLVLDSEVIVETRKTGTGTNATLTFWELDANEVFPHIKIQNGARKREVMSGFNEFHNLDAATGLIVGAGVKWVENPDKSTTLSGSVQVLVPTSVTISANVWVSFGTDVIVVGGTKISVASGIRGSDVFDRVAGTGVMQFVLQNYDPVGKYSPGHANVATNFQIGAPVRLQISGTTATPKFTKFLGRITKITPSVERSRNRTVTVTCVDAMDVLSTAIAKGLVVRTNITAKRIVEICLNAATGIPIVSTQSDGLDETPDVYDFAFDGIRDEGAALISEIQKAVESERGWFYAAYQNSLVGSDGGFRFESRETREASPVFATEAGGSMMKEFESEHTQETVYNRVQGRVFPRTVDGAPTTILFTLDNAPKLKHGESITFSAPYRDPAEQASRVSGTEMQPPVGGVDYKLTAKADGGGTDYTSNLSVVVEFGGSSAEVTLQNLGPTAHVSLFQLKGKGLFSYEPITVTKRDVLSIVEHGLSDIIFELPHQEDLSIASEVADNVLEAYKQPQTFIRSAALIVPKSETNLDEFLSAEIGDKYFVEDTVLGIDRGTTTPFVLGTSELDGTDELADAAAIYAIHSIEFDVKEGNEIDARWGMFPSEVRL